jgi:hypothetical protein
MRLFLRLRPGVLVIATVAVVAAMAGVPAPSAHAFYIQNHERITRDALTPAGVDPATMNEILVGPPPGAGAVDSDAFVSDAFRHIDNAQNPADICARAQEAWKFFTPIVLSGGAPAGPDGGDLANGPAARAAFGGLAHALQDFYSHSNWIEDNIAVGQLERMPPPLMPTCDPATLPAGLHTGFFSMDFSSDFPLGGCPLEGPPPGFAECHSTLNKDGWDTARGVLRVPGANPPMSYFDLAALLATRATTDLYSQVRGLVASAHGECAAVNLFQVDRHQPCW